MEKPNVDSKTRDNLAYLWSMAIIAFVGYTLIRFGEFKEILTLLIGFISGTASTILALYFGGVLAKNHQVPGTAEVSITATAETSNTTNAPTE